MLLTPWRPPPSDGPPRGCLRLARPPRGDSCLTRPLRENIAPTPAEGVGAGPHDSLTMPRTRRPSLIKGRPTWADMTIRPCHSMSLGSRDSNPMRQRLTDGTEHTPPTPKSALRTGSPSSRTGGGRPTLPTPAPPAKRLPTCVPVTGQKLAHHDFLPPIMITRSGSQGKKIATEGIGD